MKASNCDLGIASEGYFGAHPTLFFIPADDEILIFIDQKNNLEIVAREISTKTNFKGKIVKTYEELLDFAKNALFPSHALILRNGREENEGIIKGIRSSEELKQAFESIHSAKKNAIRMARKVKTPSFVISAILDVMRWKRQGIHLD